MGIEPVCIVETPYEIVQQFTIMASLNKAGKVKALVDSGAAGNFINQQVVKELRLPTIPRKGSLRVTHVKGGKVGTVDRQVKCYMRIRDSKGNSHRNYKTGCGSIRKTPSNLGITMVRSTSTRHKLEKVRHRI